MAGGVQLDSASQDDAAQIAKVFATSRDAAMPWLPKLHSADDDLQFFANRVLPNQMVTVARKGNEVLGFSAFSDGWLNHLYVAPIAWRQRLGSALLRRVLADQPSCQLWVFAKNTSAQMFYTRHGFHCAERTDGSGNEEKCADIRMVWSKPV